MNSNEATFALQICTVIRIIIGKSGVEWRMEKMDGAGDQLRCFGICSWLYNLIMKTLAAQTLKTVILGQPQPGADASGARPASRAQGEEHQQIEIDSNQKTLGSVAGIDAAQSKAPKKSVSINDRAVEIIGHKKKMKPKMLPKTRRRSLSMDHLGDIDGEKPLKSILKVGSNLHARSTSFG